MSVVVAIALTAAQRDGDKRREDQLRLNERRQQRADEKENLQLTLTLEEDLTGLALPGRDLSGLFLVRKILKRANLQGADLRRSDLSASVFDGATLRWARLDRARMAGTRFVGTDLREARFDGANLSGVYFRGAKSRRLNETSFRHATLNASHLERAELVAADLTESSLYEAQLDWVDARQTILRDADLMWADLHGANLAGADLRGASLQGTNFCGAAGLDSARLAGAQYSPDTRWPRGFDPKSRGATKDEFITVEEGSLGQPVCIVGPLHDEEDLPFDGSDIPFLGQHGDSDP
ncbi:pentapeptide repeat-containing protein [Solirubrobacter sp. CPCC 204708]|uniref:Pentapeptide repeat-containing protein n=1 Tax=Solirubrobacter deserti TaxID=2282478 RepID=A0ABT4RK27_9ACTN|nr:pentapeptide repeat-containing protein [Solirubrobacter deserti]MBE2315768.1 pentapeptide repeat-containing protein [Solirubrobacter deserti]MDA0138894.1 pentapeptide repeat-containing protein [Solirubrobacter deserti]